LKRVEPAERNGPEGAKMRGNEERGIRGGQADSGVKAAIRTHAPRRPLGMAGRVGQAPPSCLDHDVGPPEGGRLTTK